nr:Na(+)/H(+) antiporter subunit C [Arthrobacter woluwensis]
MSANMTLLVIMGILYACGIYLLLERSLTRVTLGLMLLANATNLLILVTGGYAGLAPLFVKGTDPHDYNDPLPQALILTSIVISFAVTAFMLGIIYRTWVLGRQDVIADDTEDQRVANTPSFDAEDDAVIPDETTEFPLTADDDAQHGAVLAAVGAATHAHGAARSDGSAGEGDGNAEASVNSTGSDSSEGTRSAASSSGAALADGVDTETRSADGGTRGPAADGAGAQPGVEPQEGWNHRADPEADHGQHPEEGGRA